MHLVYTPGGHVIFYDNEGTRSQMHFVIDYQLRKNESGIIGSPSLPLLVTLFFLFCELFDHSVVK